MPTVPHNLETEKPAENFSILLIGKEQSGKSWLAATAPKNVLFIDTDLKAGSLAGRKGVFALSIMDTPPNKERPDPQPDGFNEILDKLTKLERRNSLQALDQTWPDQPVSTLVFDSVQTVASLAQRYTLYTADKDIKFSVSLGGRQFRVPKSYTAWGAEMGMVESCIMQARSLPNMNIIVILHETQEEDPRSTDSNPIYTGKIEVFPVRYKILLKNFTEVWRLVRSGPGAPRLYCAPNVEFGKAGSALLKTEAQIENPDISQIIAKARASAPR